MSKTDQARDVMLKAHKGQTRRGGEPYSVHPIDVVETLEFLGVKDENIICSGYLHDVLEDTKYGSDMIKSNFGKSVLDIVNELTFPPDVSDEDYWKKCGAMSSDAKWVKMADIISNLGTVDEKSSHFVTKRVKALKIIVKGLNLPIQN
ncbi:MAG: HD domain-containing protein [Nitrosopumilus sp.]|nr:HD domain-containing protein [Nitrosopumilus sp.]